MTTQSHAGVSRCWHETDQINACEGNRSGGGVALDQGCNTLCTSLYTWVEQGSGIVLPAVPPYLRPPSAGGSAETQLDLLSTWHNNLSYTPNHDDVSEGVVSPTSGTDPTYPDGWYLNFRLNGTSPYQFNNVNAFPSQYLLDEHGASGDTLLSENTLNAATLGGLSNENDTGGFANEAIRGARDALGLATNSLIVPGNFQFPVTDLQYRNCVRGCGSMLAPMAMDASTDFYPPTHYVPFDFSDPPYTTDPGDPSSAPTLGNYTISSLVTPPIDPEFPIVERYESCWRECVVETTCDDFCQVGAPYDENNPRTFAECPEMCEESLYFKYDNPGAPSGYAANPGAFCLDECETLVSSGGYDDCSSYWEPKLRARARVGAAGCSWINVKKTSSWTAQVEWDSLDSNKRNPHQRVSTPGNVFAGRYYVAGIDGHDVGPGLNPAICVYDMGPSWWFQGADAVSSLGRTREGGRERSHIPKANFPNGRDETAFDSESAGESGTRLCYKLPLPNGPHPCCITIAADPPTPIVIDLKASNFSLSPPSTVGDSTFFSPSIRVEFPGTNARVDLVYSFTSNVFVGDPVNTNCRTLSDPTSQTRTFCAGMPDEQTVCAYEQESGNFFPVGCYERDLAMPDTAGMFELTPSNSTFSDPGFDFKMNGATIQLKASTNPCDKLFNYTFCLDNQQRRLPPPSGPPGTEYLTTDRVYCVANVRNPDGSLVSDVQAYTDANNNDDFNGASSVAVGLCVDIPPIPCGYPSGITTPGDPLHGFAIWPVQELVGGAQTIVTFALENPSYETYRIQNPSSNFGVRYCPPGYAAQLDINGNPLRPFRVCEKQNDGTAEYQPVTNPCVRVFCPAETLTGTATPDNMESRDTIWAVTAASTGIETIAAGSKAQAQLTTNGIPRYCVDIKYRLNIGQIPERGCNHNGEWTRPDGGATAAEKLDIAIPPGHTVSIEDQINPACVPRGCNPTVQGNASFGGALLIDNALSGMGFGNCINTPALPNGDLMVRFDSDVTQSQPNGTRPEMTCVADPNSPTNAYWDRSTFANDCVRMCAAQSNLGDFNVRFLNHRSNDNAGIARGYCNGDTWRSGAPRMRCDINNGWVHPTNNTSLSVDDDDCGCRANTAPTINAGGYNYSFSNTGITFRNNSSQLPCLPSIRLNGSVRVRCNGNDTWGTPSNTCSWRRAVHNGWELGLDGYRIWCTGSGAYCNIPDLNATSYCMSAGQNCYLLERVQIFNTAPNYDDVGLQVCTGTNYSGSCKVYTGVGNLINPQFKNGRSVRTCYDAPPHQCSMGPEVTWPQ